MLLESGDLIPVRPEAVEIPWTRRKAQILNFLLRGPVSFKTQVYDTNVGDIAPLSTYFNPFRWTVKDLNDKFGLRPVSSVPRESSLRTLPAPSGECEVAKSKSLQPRLLIYAEESESSSLNSDDVFAPLESQTTSSSMLNINTLVTALRPKSTKASSVPNLSKQLRSPTSPVQEWLRPSWDDSEILRPSSISPTGSIEPIGPPKRRKMTFSPTWESQWLAQEDEGVRKNLNNNQPESSLFSIFTEKDSPWSLWTNVKASNSGLSGTEDYHRDEDNELVVSLRRIAQESREFLA